MLTPSEAARRAQATELTDEIAVEPVEIRTSFLQWGPIIAGALVAAALSLVLITFGSAIGFGVLSSSPTWRDASPALTVASGTTSPTATTGESLIAYELDRLFRAERIRRRPP